MRKLKKSSLLKTKEVQLADYRKLPHMVVYLEKDGNIHVHAPFENKYLMTQFMDSIIKEQRLWNAKLNNRMIK